MLITAEDIKEHPHLEKIIFLDSEGQLIRQINGSYIARRFFNRSTPWFCQKLNHTLKNKRPQVFSSQELCILKYALRTIANDLLAISERL